MDTKGNQNGTGKQKRDLSRRPAREFSAGLSKDGKYWLLRDTTTWFIPVNYLEAIRKSHAEKRAAISSTITGEVKTLGGADDRSH
jgi:hypothetical protein